ncbi:DNA-directed RNA polymerase I subunit RPA1 [Palaemon carinicauda]|uniref:DNA-directed RNA polymerase I subunit RPA1 n=1 Tax=Palaemon carinicauda TaxID=392227 RepID=UPI0035B5B6E6
MGGSGQEYVKIENLGFRIYTDDEIKKIAVMRISNPETFNRLGHISTNGLYDLRLGPIMPSDDICGTCRLNAYNCAGHCGHIELPLPVYNPIFYDTLRKIISHICFSCYKFVAKKERILQLTYQIKLLNMGFLAEAVELEDYVSQVIACSKAIEAEEVALASGKNKEEKGGLPSSMLYVVTMKLDSYLIEAVQKGTSHTQVTSSENVVRETIRKKFWDSTKVPKSCPFCGEPLVKIALQNYQFVMKNGSLKKDKEKVNDNEAPQLFLTPKQIQIALRKCWKTDKIILGCLYPLLSATNIEYPTDTFFLNTLLVVPPKFHPYDKRRDGYIIEHESVAVLKNIIKLSVYMGPLISVLNGSLKEIPEDLTLFYKEISGDSIEEKCQNMWYQIQCNVNALYDAGLSNNKQTNLKGIRQVIEKKAGLMRHNLMGKRVNFSARSVAAPDPHIALDEVGVPMDFAIKLSYPVPVNDWNVEEMRVLVMNGPEKYPGALMVEDEEGKKVHLGRMDSAQRSALAKKLLTPLESCTRKVNAQKIVYRQLKNGDYILMNRQPTLHRPSIQAHRARVMAKDRVLRMPYANCKAYNADFDGDEFNMHFPQNELARSEAKHIVTTHNQYLTPKDGSPLAGLIQDSVVSSVKISMRGKFFNREDYHQLVYSALPNHMGRIVLLPPCILKPQQLWSGKQVISTLLYNVIPSNKARPTFSFKTSVKVDIWETSVARKWRGGGVPEKRREALTESEFIMRDGELLCGVVDKCAIGSTSHGLIHICYELYGGPIAYKIMTAVNRMCVYYLQWVGHTITAKDFVTPFYASHTRRESLKQLVNNAPLDVFKKLDLHEAEFQDFYESAHMSHNEKNMAAIDGAYTSALGPSTSRITARNEKLLLRPNLDNQMKMMVDTGAKGSKVNMNQMASLFGSVAVDGKRMPLSVTGKSLPSFKSYDTDPCSGGYIPNRFMTGINPKSYFFLCIVGRDSLQHTAVKTANSGYVQRCLIKHLEGIHVDYDMTVRNSDGLVLQFNYGEDGLDVTKVPFLSNMGTMDVLVNNYSRLLDSHTLSTALSLTSQEQMKRLQKQKKLIDKSNLKKRRENGFLRFCKKIQDSVDLKIQDSVDLKGYSHDNGRTHVSLRLQQLWHKLPLDEKKRYNKKVKKVPDPVNSIFSSASNLGVVSEAMDNLIEKYYNAHYLSQLAMEQKLSRDEVEQTIHVKALMSKVDPGEAVGALCAQALGEPLTQMTLNTFHFAGKDELNVTLGVPRMIEILRTGSKRISTPIMEVPFYSHVTKQQAEKLRLTLSEVSLAKVLHKMNVVSRLGFGSSGKLERIVKVKLSFLPHKSYKHLYAVTPADVLAHVEKYFFIKLLKEIFKALKREKIHCSMKQIKKKILKPSKESEEGLEEQQEEKVEDLDDKVEENDSDASSDNDDDDQDRTFKGKGEDFSEEEEDEEEGEDEKSDADSNEEGNEKAERDINENFGTFRKREKCSVSNEEAINRIENLKCKASCISNYDLDREKQLWCEVELMLPVADGAYDIVSIVRELSEQSLVRNISGIRRVFVVEKDNQLVLRTEGVNVLKMFAYEHLLDVNKLYTNNIHEVAQMYGIEAAQRSIIREIRAVQSAYDIKVDFRHLSLLADYFTCEGIYKACSRSAISTCSSPIQKMSFETCSQFLKAAITQSEKENMKSPSSNIMVGQPLKFGTNAMQLRYSFNKSYN